MANLQVRSTSIAREVLSDVPSSFVHDFRGSSPTVVASGHFLDRDLTETMTETWFDEVARVGRILKTMVGPLNAERRYDGEHGIRVLDAV